MKLPISIAFVALLLASAVFAEMPAVNVKFDSDMGRTITGTQTKNMTVGENYFFSLRLYDVNGQETYPAGDSGSRCVVTGGVGEANASTGTCSFYAKKAGKGTLTYFYRAANFGYDLSATINITVEQARCAITPKLQTIYPLQKRGLVAECSSQQGARTSCPAFQWRATAGNFSNQRETITGMARTQSVDYTSSQYAGSYKIYAIDGELSDPSVTYCEMIMEVLPGSASKVSIAPNSATVMVVGQTVALEAVVKDLNNNTINDSKITWSVNGSMGNVSQKGVFTANRAGSGTVKATVDCPFMAAGCPFAAIEVAVRESQSVQAPTQTEAPPAPPAAAPAGNDMPPAPPSDTQASAQSQQQPATAASQQGMDFLSMAGIAFAVGVGLAAAFFLATARRKR